MPSRPDPYHALEQCLENGTKLGAGACTAIEVNRRPPGDPSAVKLRAYVGGCDSAALCSLLDAHELGHISKDYLLSELSKIEASETKCSKCMIERIKELIEQLHQAAPIAGD